MKENSFQDAVDRLKKVKLWGLGSFDAWHLFYWSVFAYRFVGGIDINVKNILTRIVFAVKDYSFCNTIDKIVFYKSNKYQSRRDMIDIMERFVSCDDRIVTIDEIDKRPWTVAFFPLVFFAAQWVLALYKAGFRGLQLRIILFHAIDAFRFYSSLKRNRASLTRAKAFVVLNDEYCDENLFIQFGIQNNIPTATLQHGAYSKDSHVFKNLTADRIFVLGEYQKKLAIESGISPEKIIITGIHKYINHTGKRSDRKRNVFGLVLDGVTQGPVNKNFDLIKIANAIAQTYHIQYLVKIHPGDNNENYKSYYEKNTYSGTVEKAETVLAFADRIDFTIACTSSVFFELIYLNVPVFRYHQEKWSDIYPDLSFGRFSNLDEFEEIYSKLLAHDQKYEEELSVFRDYCCGKGDATDNYKKALSDLIALGKCN